MPEIRLFLPLLDSQFGCMIAGGILLFIMSACSSSAKAAARIQALAFCSFTAGSLMVVKGVVEAYQR